MYRYGKTSIKSLSFSLTVINYFCLGGDIIKTEKHGQLELKKRIMNQNVLPTWKAASRRRLTFLFDQSCPLPTEKKYFRN